MYNGLEDLVGKTILEVRMGMESTYIQFETDEGVFSYFTQAECCSESWINHISGLQAILGQKVLKTEQMDMPDICPGQEDFSGKDYIDSVYSFKIFTSQGVCEIEMRNASNGYYGGNLEKVEFIDKVKPIVEDF